MKRTEIQTYQLGDMRLIYEQDEEGNTGMILIPDSSSHMLEKKKDYKIEPLVQVKLLGDDYPFGFSQGRTMRNSESVRQLDTVSQECVTEQGKTCIYTYLKDKKGCYYRHQVSYDIRSQALELTTTITSRSDRDITVEMLSSFTLGAITPFDEEAEEGQLILHRLRSTWSAEGRLDSRPIEELQLEPSWQKFSSNSIRYGQVGSAAGRSADSYGGTFKRPRDRLFCDRCRLVYGRFLRGISCELGCTGRLGTQQKPLSFRFSKDHRSDKKLRHETRYLV